MTQNSSLPSSIIANLNYEGSVFGKYVTLSILGNNLVPSGAPRPELSPRLGELRDMQFRAFPT